MIVHGYTQLGVIEATIDDHVLTIPDDMANRHRQMIAAWEAEGNTIPPYVAPVPSSTLVNAERERRIAAGALIAVPGVGAIPVTGREEDQRNLQGLAIGAQLRVQVGDTSTVVPFRDGVNQMHYLTPPQVLDLWKGAASYVSAVYQSSWTIKALDPIPPDFRDDFYWPAAAQQ